MVSVTGSKQPVKRLESLDALRGFDMFWIVGGAAIVRSLNPIFDSPVTRFINTQLRHVEWSGFRIWDIIMPLFLFIVGAAIPFSINKRLASGQSRTDVYKHTLRRFLILWFLGLIVQGNLLQYNLAKLDLFSNTLQAIAAGYLIAVLAYLNLDIKGFSWLLAGKLLLFWGLMALVPVTGHGAGSLTADGNLAIHIDRAILGSFDDGLAYTWILSSITFAATVMMGVVAGRLLQSEKKEMEKVWWLLGLGVGSIGLGLFWSIWFPIIKKLWTSSFVLFSGGICLLLLALFYLIIDVWGFRRWAFFLRVIGLNAIAVYVASHIFDFRLITKVFLGSLSSRLGNWYGLMVHSAAFLIIWLILWWMYRKKTFIKI